MFIRPQVKRDYQCADFHETLAYSTTFRKKKKRKTEFYEIRADSLVPDTRSLTDGRVETESIIYVNFWI